MRNWATFIWAIFVFTLAAPKVLAVEEPIYIENYVENAEADLTQKADAMPGEPVLCRSVIHLPDTLPVVLHGKLSAGLSLKHVLQVSCDKQEINASYYTLTTTHLGDGCAFEIHLAEGFAEAGGECEIEIVYTVYLNEACLIGSANTLAIAAERSGVNYAGDPADVFTWAVPIYRGVRTLGDEEYVNPLSGVSFMVTKGEHNEERLIFAEIGEGVYKVCPGSGCNHARHSAVIRTPVSGLLRAEGLSEGIYHLKETKTPSGHEPSAEYIEIRIDQNGYVSSDALTKDGVVYLLDTPEIESVQSGEKDPLIFYRIGCVFLLLVGVFLFWRIGIPVGFISFPSSEKGKRRGSRKIPLR